MCEICSMLTIKTPERHHWDLWNLWDREFFSLASKFDKSTEISLIHLNNCTVLLTENFFFNAMVKSNIQAPFTLVVKNEIRHHIQYSESS